MEAMIQKVRRFAAVLVGMSIFPVAAQPSQLAASEARPQEVRIGVLAYLGAEAAAGEWSAVLQRLRESIPDRRFALVQLDHHGLDRAAAAGRIDFVVTNPGHYVELESEVGASRILTLQAGKLPAPDRAVGSAVVALASRGQNGYDAERGLPPERRRLELRVAPAEGGIRFAVRDFGAGLDGQGRERLFEPFFTTKPDGLGLGLSICKTIAEAHGGRLSAEPAANGPGMTFTLGVPDHD